MEQGTVLLREYALSWKESKHLTGQLLIALCDLSLQNIDAYEHGFIPIEIVEAVTKVRGGSSWVELADTTACSDRVRQYWNKLLPMWESKKHGIYQLLNDHGIKLLPDIKKVEGGGSGNNSRYFIVWSEQPVSEENSHATVDAYMCYELKYLCEDISNPGLITRLFAKGMDLSGWRRYVFASWLVVPIIIGTFGILMLLAQVILWDSFGIERIFRTFVGISLLIFAIWLHFGPFIFLPDKRITVAPFWLQSDFNDRLIELTRYPVRTLKAVHYSSVCPHLSGESECKFR